MRRGGGVVVGDGGKWSQRDRMDDAAYSLMPTALGRRPAWYDW